MRLLVFLPYVIPSVIVLVSIAQVILAYIQTQEAHKKNVDASNALRIAVSASEDVNKMSVEAKKKLAELDRSIQDGNRAVMELQLLTRFDTVVINAQIDDRDAYEQLRIWAEDVSFPLKETAIQTMQTILDESDSPVFQHGFKVPWEEGVDPNKLTLSHLWETYKSAPERIRMGIIEFLWVNRVDISKKERLQFLADVLRDDKSLKVVKFAGHYFSEGTGDGFVPLAIKEHLEWWEKNKETVK